MRICAGGLLVRGREILLAKRSDDRAWLSALPPQEPDRPRNPTGLAAPRVGRAATAGFLVNSGGRFVVTSAKEGVSRCSPPTPRKTPRSGVIGMRGAERPEGGPMQSERIATVD